MIYILLSILCSTGLFVTFKLFGTYKINILQAIIFNYIVACVCGVIDHNKVIPIKELINTNWFYMALLLGAIFISVFNFMAIATQRNGLSVSAVASKMSLIIPVLFGVFAYNETIGWIKAIGILLALASVYLVTVNPKKTLNKGNLLFPILVFFGSGLIDTSLKYLQTNFVAEQDTPIFSATLFGAAGILGIGIILFQIVRNKFVFQFRNLIGGVLLGIINYYSLFFLIKALNYKGMESNTLFTINNIGILLGSTLLGVALFREKLTTLNKIGILLASLGIVLVSLSSQF